MMIAMFALVCLVGLLFFLTLVLMVLAIGISTFFNYRRKLKRNHTTVLKHFKAEFTTDIYYNVFVAVSFIVNGPLIYFLSRLLNG